MKVVFFGSAEISIPFLEALHHSHQVVAVVSNPDKPIGRKQTISANSLAAVAQNLNIPTFKPEKIKDNQEILDQLKNLQADIFIVVAYGKILPKEILELPKFKTLNVHFSLLPKYRGASPVQYALLHGEAKTGSCIMLMDEKLDHGPILSFETMPIEADDTNVTLQKKLAVLSVPLLLRTLDKYELGQITATDQDHLQASYSKLINKVDGKVNWQKSAQEIYNQYKAYQPWPGIYTTFKNKQLKIIACAAVDTPSFSPIPGAVNNNLVQCGSNTVLKLISVQIEGKTKVDISDFINGNPDFKNSVLS